MSKTKLEIIKPALSVSHATDGELLSRLHAVHDGLLDNPAYPTPPFALADFKAAIDAYAASIAAGLDGGKAAIIERHKCRNDVIVKFRLLGHYVEGACKNDMKTFVSSGFVPATRQRTPAQPVGSSSIVKIDQRTTGQLLVTIQPVAKARSYELRHAPAPAGGPTVIWTTTAVASTKPPIPINNLTPGVIYTFQVRAFGKLGFSDWSGSVERMVI
jgi:hypothetical protein